MSENTNQTLEKYLRRIRWNRDGLVPAIAQEQGSGKVLTLAWMNAEALRCTVEKKQAVYWSRSRQKLWHKGESSGSFQHVREIRLDCDADAILLSVVQQPVHEQRVACHTGRASCFYLRLQDGEWREADPVLVAPEKLYAGRDDPESGNGHGGRT